MFVDKKWVTKKNYKEMKRALAICNEQLNRPIPLFKVEKNVIKVAASYEVPVMTINQEPEEYIKKEIRSYQGTDWRPCAIQLLVRGL